MSTALSTAVKQVLVKMFWAEKVLIIGK